MLRAWLFGRLRGVGAVSALFESLDARLNLWKPGGPIEVAVIRSEVGLQLPFIEELQGFGIGDVQLAAETVQAEEFLRW